MQVNVWFVWNCGREIGQWDSFTVALTVRLLALRGKLSGISPSSVFLIQDVNSMVWANKLKHVIPTYWPHHNQHLFVFSVTKIFINLTLFDDDLESNQTGWKSLESITQEEMLLLDIFAFQEISFQGCLQTWMEMEILLT